MKRKVLVSLMLSMVLTFGMTACGGEKVEESATSQKEQVQESKQEQSESETSKEEEEVKVDLTGNYKWVDTDSVDEYDYAENVLTFVGNNEVIKIKGYLCYDIYNGAGIAYTKYGPDGQQGIISKDGEVLVPMGQYDSLERAGTHQVFNYVKARDVKTQKFGVISVLGEEVVPFQYDEIQIRESYLNAEEGFCLYICKQGEVYDLYTVDGKLMAEGMSSWDYSLVKVEDSKGNMILTVHFIGTGETCCIVEGKEGFLEKPKDYVEGWDHCGDRIFRYVDTNGEYKYICYSDDWESTTQVDFLKDNAITRVGDNWFAANYYSAYLFDMDGNQLQHSEIPIDIVLGYDGEVAYINKGVSFFSSKPATLYNEKFEEVLEVSDSKRFYPAGGMLYATPLDGATEPKDLYDLKGNLLYENVQMISYDEEKVRFLTEDGIYGFKSKDMPEAVFAGAGETYHKSDGIFDSWFCFINEAGQYIFRDGNMNHIITFDGSATYYPNMELFYYSKDVHHVEYYNKQGELMYSKE